MLQEIDSKVTATDNALHVSVEAAQAVKNILTERNLDGYALRVYVAGSGCSGVQFGMALDNNFRTSDLTFETEGIQVLVDEMSIEYLRGAKIDFVNDPQRGAGFVVDSPLANQGGGCSCGSQSQGENETCGCGGSCGCGGH